MNNTLIIIITIGIFILGNSMHINSVTESIKSSVEAKLSRLKPVVSESRCYIMYQPEGVKIE